MQLLCLCGLRGGCDVGVDRICPWGYTEVMEDRKVISNLKRVQGQVGGIIKMMEGKQECEKILTQISAAMSSLKSVGRSLIAAESSRCSTQEYDKLLRRYL